MGPYEVAIDLIPFMMAVSIVFSLLTRTACGSDAVCRLKASHHHAGGGGASDMTKEFGPIAEHQAPKSPVGWPAVSNSQFIVGMLSLISGYQMVRLYFSQ